MIKDVKKEILGCVPILKKPCLQEVVTACVWEFFEYCEEYFETDDPNEIIDKLCKTDWELLGDFLDDAYCERKAKTNVAIFETCIDSALPDDSCHDTHCANIAIRAFRNIAINVIELTISNIILRD